MATIDAPPGGAPLAAGDGLLDVLAGFVKELRTAGIPVSLTENLDAVEALRHVPLDDREAFKYFPGRHHGEEQRPLEGLRDGLRGVLLAARFSVPHHRGSGTPTRPTRWSRTCWGPAKGRLAAGAKV